MNRHLLYITLLVISFNSLAQQKIEKTEAEWKEILNPIQYSVLREKGTESPSTGIYNKHYKDGIYRCAGCKTALFDSKNKYN